MTSISSSVSAPSAPLATEARGAGFLGAGDLPSWPVRDETERTALLRALDQEGWWRVAGGEVDAFEQEFARFNGAPHALAVTNGTAALQLALRVLGVGPGDDVVVPAFTFISTSMAVQNLGAVPVVADVDPRTLCLGPAEVEAALTPRTKVVIPVHMAGQLADVAGIVALCGSRGIEVVQDAAHSPGAVRDGVAVGAMGTIACYSFQNGKLMTSGEGGALTFPDPATRERAYLMHTCGRPAGDIHYRHVTAGDNFRLNEFSAAVLRAQLARLATHTPVRERGGRFLDQLFAAVPGVSVQQVDPEVDVNPRYMYLLTLDERFSARDRDRVVATLKARGVPACQNFPPVYRTQTYLAGPTDGATTEQVAARCPVSEAVGERGLWLHHRVLLADPATLEKLARIVADVVAAEVPRGGAPS